MKYWVYMNGEVPGSFLPEELIEIPDFADTSLVCPAEGGIENRNWRHAGEFQELAEALSSRKPAPPVAPPQPPQVERPAGDHAPLSAEDILNDASTRIFHHVTDLMRELENRREERALNQSLQRQVAELKNELLAARERIQHLDGRASLVPGFEEREERHRELLARTQREIKEQGEKLSKEESDLQRVRGELEAARAKAEELQTEVQRGKTLNDELSGNIAAKELTLARAFAMIKRLEESLRNIVPDATSGISREVPYPAEPAAEEVPPAPVEEPQPTAGAETARPPEEKSAGARAVSWLNRLFPTNK